MIKNIFMLFLLLFTSCFADEKMYLNEEEIKTTVDKFYIHQGGNVWIHTPTIHRDKQGLFTFESDLGRIKDSFNVWGYEKTWRCPYCNQHWPIGKPCQNSDCPSRYK